MPLPPVGRRIHRPCPHPDPTALTSIWHFLPNSFFQASILAFPPLLPDCSVPLSPRQAVMRSPRLAGTKAAEPTAREPSEMEVPGVCSSTGERRARPPGGDVEAVAAPADHPPRPMLLMAGQGEQSIAATQHDTISKR